VVVITIIIGSDFWPFRDIGIGLGADTPEKLCQNIRKNKKALSRWTRTKVLIMDEGRFLRSPGCRGEMS
jgi:hypothetical protein